MVNFPIIKQLDIDGYALYPGTDSVPGLHIDFSKQGLTLVLGANGLGKSTLINILFRMLSGPFDLSKFEGSEELGNLNITAIERKDLKLFFSDRVYDNAVNATATLVVSFGLTTLTISRNLGNLAIIDLKVDQTSLPLSNRVADEEYFQKEIQSLAKVGSFGDWLLILHYIVFYQENRRALVWDTSAQRELLRILLLDNDKSLKWQELSRTVLELDSEYRNLRYTVNKQIKKLKEERTPEDKSGLKSQAGALKSARAKKIIYLDKIEKNINDTLEKRALERSLRLRTKQEIDSIERHIEKSKDEVLNSFLPNASDALRFIISTLNSHMENFHNSEQIKNNIESIEKNLKEYINSLFYKEHDFDELESSNIDIEHQHFILEKLRITFEQQKKVDQELEQEIIELYSHLETCKNEIAELNYELIPIEIGIAKKGDPTSNIDLKIMTLEGMISEKADELSLSTRHFKEYLDTVEHTFLSNTDKIKDEFSKIVQSFLVEESEITWYSVPWKLGQTNTPLNFPAFIFKMKSGGNEVTTERNSPLQVSESQREFIDLAFRIALITTTGSGSSGSIIMDTPEASLDAIFVRNATNIFINFANYNDNKLLLASNLVDGELLPRLVASLTDRKSFESGVVNLLEIATPSKAVIDFKDEYYKKYNNVISNSLNYTTNQEG